MKKKISVLCSVIAIFALLITLVGAKLPVAAVKTDASTAVLEQYYDDADDMNTTLANEPTEAITSSGSSLGGLLGGLGGSGDFGSGILEGIGGIGGIFGDTGDVIGSVIGGASGGSSGGSSGGVVVTTKGGNDYVLIDPVPAATQSAATVTVTAPESTAATTTPVEETIDAEATSNPYAKPVIDVYPGDMGDGVKWIQWIFVYTGYGLADGKITGIYEGETVELVKKLQAESGLTADGVVNEATVDKIEFMYYQHMLGVDDTTTLPSTTAGVTTVGATEGTDDGENDSRIIIIAIVLIALVWIAAIAVIVILIVKKKKGKGDAVQTPKADSQPGEMNLSDLFEEANSKKK